MTAVSFPGWNDENVVLLKEGIDAGHSSRKIAAVIGTTRNAVIGKARRLGLIFQFVRGANQYGSGTSPWGQHKPRRPAPVRYLTTEEQGVLHRALRRSGKPVHPRRPAKDGTVSAVKKIIRDAVDQSWREPAQLPPPPAELLKIENLSDAVCHWPIGDPRDLENFRYCGAAVGAGRSNYCVTHHSLAYVAGSRRRKSDWITKASPIAIAGRGH
jgi:GcrA cell cycle regulator